MLAQNFFYYTFSIAIIAIAIFVCVAIIYWLIILRKFYTIVERIDKTIELVKSKIKISTGIALVSQAIKEIIEFIREKRKSNNIIQTLPHRQANTPNYENSKYEIRSTKQKNENSKHEIRNSKQYLNSNVLMIKTF